jgi:flagellar hook-associated protein 2
MGTVGINFGSASSGQGFDVASTVTQILANEQQIESPWKSQLSALQAQDSAFTTLGNDLSTLTTKMQALTDFNGVMSQKQGSSSNTNVLALTGASQTAAAGSHTITVTSLAQTSSNYSDAITNASDVLSGSLTIQVGSGTSNTVTVNSSSNTLASLATAINSAGIGVSATVISDASGSRLSLVSGTDGAAGQLTISSALSDTATSTAIGFATGQTGANGSLNVDGIVLSTASNTVTNAIPGVTFQLLAAAPGTPVQVQITNDNAAVESAVNDFVNAYNTVANDIKTQEGKDASGKAQPLYGNPTLSLIQGQLSNAILGGSASGSISSVTQMGITLNNDGTLTLDGNALATALNNNFANVTGFLQNANSFGQNFASILNGLGTQAPSGDVYLSQQQNQAEELALNQSISAEDARIAAQKTTLTTELNSANQILQSIPAQLNQVNEMYSAITGYNSRQMG